jgi:nuclear GTP-binding protein
MVLKSKKSKSKRTTLSKKYKIIKKVKAHLKKKAKQDKGKQHKVPKDPGIPSQWPFKEELLKDLEWQRQRILSQEKEKKASNKLKRVCSSCRTTRSLCCFCLPINFQCN